MSGKEENFETMYPGDSYHGSPKGRHSIFPATASFYARLFAGPFQWLCRLAAKGQCDDHAWVRASNRVAELVGDYCPLLVEGLDYVRKANGPCVIVANHMSTLEAFVLPGMLRPIRPVTFVVKKSLVEVPAFGAVMRSRDPVVVGRENPREDLAAVLDGGAERLGRGISIVVFPQSTRSARFDSHHFNSIGIKLARKAGVPVVPLALKTDAWGAGRLVKDFGRIKTGLPVRFKFAPPMEITGNGREQHAAICDFIGDTLADWEAADGAKGMDSH